MTDESLVCVFAYGSNMDREDYDAWCSRTGRPPSAWGEMIPARLDDHRLSFDYRSQTRGGGAANVVGAPGEVVHGLVTWVGPVDFAALDDKEGYPECYDRVERTLVLRDGRKVSAWVYQVTPQRQEKKQVPPTDHYWGLIARAAEEYDFPASYREALERVERVSSVAEQRVRAMYDSTASSYAEMMDTEIELPVYRRALAGLSRALAGREGPVLDTSCGTGHLLERFSELAPERALHGVDLSDAMVALSRKRLGPRATIEQGDMRRLPGVKEGSVAAVVSCFALHHLPAAEISPTLAHWSRLLVDGGQLFLALWEGKGAIDYGEESEVVAWRHSRASIEALLAALNCRVEWSEEHFEEEMKMNALYLRAVRVRP